MDNPIKPVLFVLFSLAFLSPVFAADLKTYKEVYQKNSAEILQSFQPKFADLQQQYQKSLDALKARAKNQGDLKKTMAAITEIERFQKEKSLPTTLDASAIPEIVKLQSGYVKWYSDVETDLTAKMGALTAKYDQALDRLQKEFVKTEKLTEAMEVQQERDQAQTALKGYASQMSDLTRQAATNAPAEMIAENPLPSVAIQGAKKDLYLVIDLSGGTEAAKYPVSNLADVPKGGWTDEYKTEKLVLKKIEPGTYTMGSPNDERNRAQNETQHKVKLTKGFYIGVFEVTQKQWERVMGEWPGGFNNPQCRDTRPVERVTYIDVRGDGVGANWPATNGVDDTSFMGVLRAKSGMAFDLPTEAQWEYACRAGTEKALNSNKDISGEPTEKHLNLLARYKGNSGNADKDTDTSVGTARVGSYLPNAWDLYDMHGNVYELCLDWFGSYPGKISDPKGAASGETHVLRGGSWNNDPRNCRSAHRNICKPNSRLKVIGFRAVLSEGQQ